MYLSFKVFLSFSIQLPTACLDYCFILVLFLVFYLHIPFFNFESTPCYWFLFLFFTLIRLWCTSTSFECVLNIWNCIHCFWCWSRLKLFSLTLPYYKSEFSNLIITVKVRNSSLKSFSTLFNCLIIHHFLKILNHFFVLFDNSFLHIRRRWPRWVYKNNEFSRYIVKHVIINGISCDILQCTSHRFSCLWFCSWNLIVDYFEINLYPHFQWSYFAPWLSCTLSQLPCS